MTTRRRTLYVGAGLAAVGGVDPAHRAVLVDGALIAWTGEPADAPPADEVVDLGRSWLAPGFVDAHVHATATGLAATGVDCTGAASGAELLDRVRAHAARTDGVVHGSGWDDLGWADGLPTADELADAAGGRPVVLTRVDGHSCLVDAGVLADLDLSSVPRDVDVDDRGRPTGWLREAAGAMAQDALWDRLTPADLRRAREATCAQALDRGITELHEMGIPGLGRRDDALAWALDDLPLAVHAWWASLDVGSDEVLHPGGDLFLDGSIGSCTAATTTPYRMNDGGTTTGALFHDDEAVAAFFTAATQAGRGAGVHAIGDRAVAQAVRAIGAAADACGLEAVRAARHRVEHVEVIDPADVARMARLGVVASVQPAFDAVWNGPGGLYEHRFGRTAADRTNPFADLHAAGVALCLSSDSTVTPLDPWGGVLAAEHHHGGRSLDRATALHAATVGGHHVVREDHLVGALRPGLRADLVAWPGDPLTEDPRGWRPVVVVTGGVRRR